VREWTRRLLILPPLVVGAAVLMWQLQTGGGPAQAPLEEVARPVRVIEVQPVEFVPRAIGYGTATPGRVWEAVAQVSGKIVEKHPDLERGRLLEAGSVLLGIDPADYRLALARSQADLDRAKAELDELALSEANARASLEIERRAVDIAEADLDRKKALLARGNTSQTVVDDAEAALLAARQRVQELENRLRLLPAERRVLEASVALAEARLDEAGLDLERTTLRLPFDARIARIGVEVGEFVGVGQVLVVADGIEVAEVDAQFSIGDLLPLVRAEVDLSTLSASELGALPQRIGIAATVRLETSGVAASWPARFDRFSDRIDPQTRTLGVIVAVDEPYRRTIPGERPPLAKDMFVQVELRGPAWPDAVVVPRVAVHRLPEGPAVHLADADDRLVVRPVVLGPAQDDLVTVRSGLEAGERVLVSDVIPAITGMKLQPQLDQALIDRLRRAASGDGDGPQAAR
jgi:RND family efflux transporter MFP subunit